jgi:hypothetical protein
MKKLLPFIALVLLAASAFGGTGIFGGYIVLSLNGGASAFYKLENPADPVTPPFSNVNFGIFDPSLGQSLVLIGGEADTFKNGGGDVTGAFLNFVVYPTSSPSNVFSSLSLPYNSELGGGDQKWQTTAANTNLLTGLPNGNYTIEVFVSATTNEGDRYLNAGGANYKATFSVVPEPSSLGLIAGPALLGAWFFLRRRRS